MTSLLAAASAVILTGLALTLFGPSVPPSQSAAAAQIGLGRRFYAAANALLAGADPTNFDPVIAPNFLAHGPDGTSLDRAGWAAQLAAIGRAAPGVQLEVTTTVADGGWIAAQVTTSGGALLAADGVIADPAPATTTELLQVADDRIVGYWPGRGLADLPQSLPPLALGPEVGPAPATLARFVYAPGANLVDLVAPGPQLLMLESGRLTIRLTGAASWFDAAHPEFGWQATAPAGQDLILAPGDALLVPAGVDQIQSNLDPDPAVTLSLAIFPQAASTNPPRVAFSSAVALAHSPTARLADDLPHIPAMFNPSQRGMWTAWPGGVQVNVLATGYGPTGSGLCSAAPIDLTITRFSLPPGMDMPAYPVAGVALVAREGSWLDGNRAAATGTSAAPALAEQGLVNVDYQLGPVRNLGARPLALAMVTLERAYDPSCRPTRPTPMAAPPVAESRRRGP